MTLAFADRPALLVLLPVAALPGLGVYAMTRFGVRHLIVNTAGICLIPVTWRERIFTQKLIDLYPGDAIVATDQQVYIWRHHRQAYEAIDAKAQWADPDDWRRLQAWALSIWPGPGRARAR